MRKANVAKAEHAHRCRRLRVPWEPLQPRLVSGGTMVSNLPYSVGSNPAGHFSLHSKGSDCRSSTGSCSSAPQASPHAGSRGSLDQGWSLNATSKHLGVSRSALREWRDHGVEPRGRPAPCFVCTGDICSEVSEYVLLWASTSVTAAYLSRYRTFSLRVSCDARYPPSSTRCPGRSGPSTSRAGSVMSEAQGSSSSRTAAGTTGRACSRSTVRAASTSRSDPGALAANKHQGAPCPVPAGALSLRRFTHEQLDHQNGCGVWLIRLPRWQFVNHSADIRRWCTRRSTSSASRLEQLEECISVSTHARVSRGSTVRSVEAVSPARRTDADTNRGIHPLLPPPRSVPSCDTTTHCGLPVAVTVNGTIGAMGRRSRGGSAASSACPTPRWTRCSTGPGWTPSPALRRPGRRDHVEVLAGSASTSATSRDRCSVDVRTWSCGSASHSPGNVAGHPTHSHGP